MIDKTIGVCRLLYNLALETNMYAYKSHGKSLSAFDLINQLPELKMSYSWIAEIDSQSAQAAIRKMGIAFSNFFRGSGYPKFKSKRAGGSFECPNNIRRIDWGKSTLTIPKIKNIPIVLSRNFDGKIKIITISRTPTNKYFASIVVEMEQGIIATKKPENAIGIDLGITDFATLSNGEKITNQRHLQSELKRLKVLQQRASRKNKGSKNRKKANLRVAILHEKITNQRKDFLHKLSTKLISDNQTDTICVEGLAVSNMVRNRKLSQAISDASWAEFVRQLEYKGKWYGKNVIKINRFYASSKTCSDCGHIKDELNLSQRTWTCSNCGSNHDRDINAAINIKKSGMGNPAEPVELLAIAGTRKQETNQKGK
jgi:putative transposase